MPRSAIPTVDWADLHRLAPALHLALRTPEGRAFVRLQADLADPAATSERLTAASDAAVAAGVPEAEVARRLLDAGHAALWGQRAGAGRFNPDDCPPGLPEPSRSALWKNDSAAGWSAWLAAAPERVVKPWSEEHAPLLDACGAPRPLHGLAWALWHGAPECAEVWWSHRDRLPAAALNDAWATLAVRALCERVVGARGWNAAPWAVRLLDAGADPEMVFHHGAGGADRLRVDFFSPSSPAPPSTTPLHAWVRAWLHGTPGRDEAGAVWKAVVSRLPWSRSPPDGMGRTPADVAIQSQPHDDSDPADVAVRRTECLTALRAAGGWTPTAHAARWVLLASRQRVLPFSSSSRAALRDGRLPAALRLWSREASPCVGVDEYPALAALAVFKAFPPTHAEKAVRAWWHGAAGVWSRWLPSDVQDHWKSVIVAAQMATAHADKDTAKKALESVRLAMAVPLAQAAPAPRRRM